jgi:telomerase reverse transcriptase
MFHLLTEASIFVPLPNECLCQLTGMPLVFLPSPAIDLVANSVSTGPIPSEKRKRKASPHPEEPSSKMRLQRTSGRSE